MNDLISLLAFGVFRHPLARLWLRVGSEPGKPRSDLRMAAPLPLIAQAAVAFLTLPVAIRLWVWETSWPLLLRLPLVVGLGVWTLAIFFPRGLIGR